MTDAPRPDRWPRAVLALSALAWLLLFLQRARALDLWWQLAAGRWIAQHGLPSGDPFSYATGGARWVDTSWGFQLLAYAGWRLGGMPLLVVGKALALLLVIALLARCGGGGGGGGVSWPRRLLVLWLVALCLSYRAMLRPELVSFAALALTLVWLERWRQRGRLPWLLPLAIAAWANAHALAFLGVLVAGAYWLGGVLERASGRAQPVRLGALGGLVAASGLALLATPYLLDGALLPLRLSTRISGADGLYPTLIGEFAPHPLALLVSAIADAGRWQPNLLAYAALVGLTLACGLRRLRQLPLGPLLVALGCLLLAERAVRNVPLFAIGVTPLLLSLLAPTGAPRPVARWCAPLAIAVALLFGAALALPLGEGDRGLYYSAWARDSRALGFDADTRGLPVAAVDALIERGLPDPIYCDLNSGGYLIWRLQALDPPRRGFIDGRLEVIPRELLADWAVACGVETLGVDDPSEQRRRIAEARRRWRALQARFRFRTLLLSERALTIPRGFVDADPRWRHLLTTTRDGAPEAHLYVR